MTSFGLAPFILEDIARVLRRYPQVQSAAIYGSRAKATYKNNSDIDLAIHAPDMMDKDYAMLHFELSELPIVFKMDVTRVDTLHNEALAEKIRREEKTIYSKNGA